MTFFDLTINLIESFTTLLIFNLVYQKKEYLKLSIFTLLSFGAITFANITGLANNVFSIVDFFIIYSYACLISKSTIINIENLFISIMSLTSLDIANTITLTIFNLIGQNTSISIVITVSKILYLILTILVAQLIKRTHYFNKKLMIISNAILLTINLIFGYQFESYFHHTDNSIITIFLLALVSILIILIFDESRQDAKKLYANQLQLNILEQQKKNYQNLQNNIKKTSKLKHDLAHIYNSIIYEINHDNLNNAINILTKQLKELENINKVIITGNDIIDYCIALQATKLTNQNIKVISESLPSQMPLNNEDLFIIFGNLFLNALENCKPNPDKIIMISTGSINEYFYLMIKNTIDRSVLKNNPHLLTNKNDPELHGIGISTCKKVIMNYDGKLVFDEDLLFFSAKIIIPKKML